MSDLSDQIEKRLQDICDILEVRRALRELGWSTSGPTAADQIRELATAWVNAERCHGFAELQLAECRGRYRAALQALDTHGDSLELEYWEPILDPPHYPTMDRPPSDPNPFPKFRFLTPRWWRS